MTAPGPIVIAGSPSALGGHFAGMDRTPVELRARGLLDRLAIRPGLGGATWRDVATRQPILAGRPIPTRG